MNTDSPSIQPLAPRRKGNVARLPKALRDLVNTMLDDGATYPAIVAALEKSTNPPLPHPVSVNNLSNWFEGGYQDYLRDQAWRERINTQADRYLDLATDDPTRLVAGGLYAAMIQICEIMDELAQPQSGETDADKLARMSNALSRMSRSILSIQQYRDKLAKEKAAEIKARDANKPGSDEDDYRAVVDMVDRVFGLSAYNKRMDFKYMRYRGDTAHRAENSAVTSPVTNDPQPEPAAPVPAVQGSGNQPETAVATNAAAEPLQHTVDEPPSADTNREIPYEERTLTDIIKKHDEERGNLTLTEYLERNQAR